MIRKLRRKLVLIVMAVVALILLAIFFTMLLTTQKNNERLSLVTLHQALDMRALPVGSQPPLAEGKPSLSPTPGRQMRLPVLIVELDKGGEVVTVSNQLHFIEATDIAPIARLAVSRAEPAGVLSDYGLRYLREETENGVEIALVDISVEQEMLQTLILNSLLIGGLALLAFFVLSLFLARWAVGPVEKAWEQQKQFIANASHELKTPLTVILSNAEMLRLEENLGDDKNARRTAHIHGEALRMKQLVEDMLTLAKSDSQEKAEILGVTDFSYLVKSAVLVYEPIFYDEGKQLSYEIAAGLFIKGDLPRLQQAVHILLDNARKYAAPHGAIRVDLSKAEHRSLLLRVSNEGAPIPKEDLAKIFLRFYRRDEARSAPGSFGLGLAIAQSIVLGHKGRIWAESDGQSNNSFYVSLPLA